MCVGVCVRARARARVWVVGVCVRARARARVWVVGVSARALACACALVVLLIQHATRLHIVIFGFSGSTTFFHIIS